MADPTDAGREAGVGGHLVLRREAHQVYVDLWLIH